MVRHLWSHEFSALAGVGKAPMHSMLFGVTLVLVLVGLAALATVILRVH